MKRGLIGLVAVLLLVFNGSVLAPVAGALHDDTRNAGFSMVAYRSFGLHPTDITIDLLNVDAAAPIDLYRGFFEAAKALRGRHFGSVTLAHRGAPIFVLAGDDFAEIGAEFDEGQNPVYLVRTLPEKLHLPDGTTAYGSWSGGILGVLATQMADANNAMQACAGQSPIQRQMESSP